MSIINTTSLAPEDVRIATAVNYLGELLDEYDHALYLKTLGEIFGGGEVLLDNRGFLIFAYKKVLDNLRLVDF